MLDYIHVLSFVSRRLTQRGDHASSSGLLSVSSSCWFWPSLEDLKHETYKTLSWVRWKLEQWTGHVPSLPHPLTRVLLTYCRACLITCMQWVSDVKRWGKLVINTYQSEWIESRFWSRQLKCIDDSSCRINTASMDCSQNLLSTFKAFTPSLNKCSLHMLKSLLDYVYALSFRC